FSYQEFLDHSETDIGQSTSLWAAKMRQTGKKLVGAAQDGAGDPEITAAKQLGMKPGQVPFICHDVSTDRLNFLKQGWFVGLVDRAARRAGASARRARSCSRRRPAGEAAKPRPRPSPARPAARLRSSPSSTRPTYAGVSWPRLVRADCPGRSSSPRPAPAR